MVSWDKVQCPQWDNCYQTLVGPWEYGIWFHSAHFMKSMDVVNNVGKIYQIAWMRDFSSIRLGQRDRVTGLLCGNPAGLDGLNGCQNDSKSFHMHLVYELHNRLDTNIVSRRNRGGVCIVLGISVNSHTLLFYSNAVLCPACWGYIHSWIVYWISPRGHWRNIIGLGCSRKKNNKEQVC